MTRQAVETLQRERLMIAGTELMAATGYASTGAREICGHAGVSRETFYRVFADKDECLFAAYDRFIAVLLQRLAQPSDTTDLSIRSRELTHAYLGTLQLDLVVARAFQVELDAQGRPARDRRRQALQLFAEYLQAETVRLEPDRPVTPISAFIGIVYAIRQIASDALDLATDPDLVSLVPELATWAHGATRGPALAPLRG